MGYGKPEQKENLIHVPELLKRNGKSHPTRPKRLKPDHIKKAAKKRRRRQWKEKGEDAPTKDENMGFQL